MRARIAKAWADFGRRASIASLSFSSGVTFSALVGRPMATPEYAAIRLLFQPCTRLEVRVILSMGNYCWSCWCIIEIAFVLWSRMTNRLVDC